MHGEQVIQAHFETSRLTFRPFRLADAPAVLAYWQSDPDWEKYNESVPAGFTERDAADFVAEMSTRDRRVQPNWAVLHHARVVGVVSLSFNEDQSRVQLGYGIHGELRGRGLVPEGVAYVIELAFTAHQSLLWIEAQTDPANLASIGVLGKLGFSRARGSDSKFQLSRRDWRGNSS